MARARTAMNQIREILRLRHGGGLSQRKVARASGCSLGTVNKVLRGAAQAGLSGVTVMLCSGGGARGARSVRIDNGVRAK